MKHLYAPWRGSYSKQTTEKTSSNRPFCDVINESHDEKNFILKRFKYTFVMLNIYPYNPGHLLALPYEHIDSLEKMDKASRAELIEVISLCTSILKKELKATGVNIGFNIGDCASGGSIPDHLHAHIVPRWKGDTNFLPVTAGIKPLSADLKEVYTQLKGIFSQL